jgi:hydrogenase nickel incorporation protein HypA/HybF
MHEYSLTCSIVEILERIIKEKSLKKVEKVIFELNPLAVVEPESIMFYFNFLTREDIILKGAKLNFKKAKIKVRCKNCNYYFKSQNFPISCPICNSGIIDIFSQNMDDIKITSISAED